MGPDRVHQHGPLADQQLPGPVQHQNTLLLSAFDRHKAHAGPRHSLADRRRIRRVVLAPLHVSFHITRWHQLDLMAKPDQLARPVMRGRTRFHAHQTRRLLLEERHDL